MYPIDLTAAEQKLAQLLTRDAWLYFSNLITQRENFHVPEIPMMPRTGMLMLPNDLEVAQYYIDSIDHYHDELLNLGWRQVDFDAVAGTFRIKIESATGIAKGMLDSRLATAG